jgi:hypothetical protein
LKNQPGKTRSHVGSVTVSSHIEFSKVEWRPPGRRPDKFPDLTAASPISEALGHVIR